MTATVSPRKVDGVLSHKSLMNDNVVVIDRGKWSGDYEYRDTCLASLETKIIWTDAIKEYGERNNFWKLGF